MKIQGTLESWSKSHVFYDMYTHQTSGRTENSLISDMELKWRKDLIANSPNGHLLVNNTFFDLLRDTHKLHLLHITTNLDRILEHKVLYPSGGCLVGSIYCTPLFQTREGLRVHNLGLYIHDREAPRSLVNRGLGEDLVKAVVIEMTYPKQSYRGLAGIDYLRLGNVHLKIFKELEYLLSRQERYRLEDQVVSCIKSSAELSSYHFPGHLV